MLIPWSGGADSTYLLWKLLTTPKGGLPVRAISINFDRQLDADSAQIEAQKAITKVIESKGYRFEHIVVTHDCTHDVLSSGNTQASLWLGLVMPYLHRYEDLYMGYVAGDCFWSLQHEYNIAFNSYQNLRTRYGKIQYPLEFVTKATIYKELKKVGLFKHVHWCQNNKPCKKKKDLCMSCFRHRTTLWQMKNLDCRNLYPSDFQPLTEAEINRQDRGRDD